MILKARLKPIGEQPKHYLCCERGINWIKEHLNEIVLVESKIIQSNARHECSRCGKEGLIPAKIRNKVNPTGGRSTQIFIDAYDFDEGVDLCL